MARFLVLLAVLAVLAALVPSTAVALDGPMLTSDGPTADRSRRTLDSGTQAGNPLVFGIASHAWWLDPETYGDQLLPALDDLGVTTVRLSIDWRRFEPTRGQYDWEMYDRVLGELAARNIVIVATFNTIPGWASVDRDGCDDPKTEIYLCQLRDDRYPDFQRAIRAAVERYAWIDHWEFWNEPEMWRYLGEAGTVYIRHLRTFYDIAHEVNPEIVVAAQTLVGADYMGYIYNLSEAWYGDDNEPWDAISLHPYVWNFTHEEYGRPLELNYDRINWLRQLMVERGDSDKPIWITEYGWNNGVEQQAINLRNAFDWLKRQPWIEFAHLHMLHDWNEEALDAFGLMAIVPDGYGVPRLTPEAVFYPKQPFYDAFKDYPKDELPSQPWDADARYFSETGQTVSGRFLRAWNQRGGLRILGLPLTRPYPREQEDGSWLLVQDFERARLEFHPEHVGDWSEVLGTLAGNDITAGRRDEEPFKPLKNCVSSADRDCYVETDHSLANGFRDFWLEHGGVATFGYPISEEFDELNPDTGRVHAVQYFERARFEYHPEHAGTEYAVLLGLLIRDDLQE
ncbi:MAG: beta-galactosidase, partial [Thermomicrobiales bacterium]